MKQLLCGLKLRCTLEAGGMEVSISDHVGMSGDNGSFIGRASCEEVEAAQAFAPILAERIAGELPPDQICGFFISFARDPRGHNLPVVVAALGEKPEDEVAACMLPRLAVHADLDQPVSELPAEAVAGELFAALCTGIRAKAIAMQATGHFLGDQGLG